MLCLCQENDFPTFQIFEKKMTQRRAYLVYKEKSWILQWSKSCKFWNRIFDQKKYLYRLKIYLKKWKSIFCGIFFLNFFLIGPILSDIFRIWEFQDYSGAHCYPKNIKSWISLKMLAKSRKVLKYNPQIVAIPLLLVCFGPIWVYSFWWKSK